MAKLELSENIYNIQISRYRFAIPLRGRMGLRAKSVNTLSNKILFTLKIEKNIPNKMAQTRVFYLIPFSKYWRFRANFGSKDYDFKSLRLTYGLLYCFFLLTYNRKD